MEDWNADEDPYKILDATPETTSKELKTKYRRLVLEKHPDKQPGNKQAAAEFIKLQRAYEILTDDKAKAALDALQRAKQAREAKQAGQSEKRRKMAAELEKREREFDAERQQEKAARNKLNAELARLRKEMANREAERQAVQLRERVAASLAGAATVSSSAADLSGERQRTLKASWDTSAGTYTETDLRNVFGKFGGVEDVILRPMKKKGKGSALVIMTNLQGAMSAASEANGRLENPLLVVPLARVPAVGQQESPQPANLFGDSRPMGGHGNQTSAGSLFPGFPPMATNRNVFAASAGANATPPFQAPNGSAAGVHSSYESDILAKMRRKAEQDRKTQGQAVEHQSGS